MKILKFFAATMLCTLFLVNTAFASAERVNPNEKLGKEIVRMIDHADFLDLEDQTVTATLLLMVNNHGELILLESGTDNPELDSYLKDKLNNKKIWTRKVQKNVIYKLKVIFKPEK